MVALTRREVKGMIKEDKLKKDKEEVDLLEGYKREWKNISITSKGSFPEYRTFASEEEAREGHIEKLERWNTLMTQKGVGGLDIIDKRTKRSIYVYPFDFKCALQMPI